MPSLKQYNEILQETESIKLVTEALGEVAALKFKATKDFIQHTSFFFSEIAKVYQTVQAIANQKKLAQNLKLAKNGRTACLLLTSNSQFYGGLDEEVSEHFAKTTTQEQVDRVVIGKTGINYLHSTNFGRTFQGLSFNHDMPTSTELGKLVVGLNNYSRVLIFHSKFVTVLNQEVEITDVTGYQTNQPVAASQLDYILEPEIAQMLSFFEGQILVALIQSIFLQTELARTAARMVSMDQAELNSEKQIEKQKMELLKLKKGLQNLRILETYTSIRKLQ